MRFFTVVLILLTLKSNAQNTWCWDIHALEKVNHSSWSHAGFWQPYSNSVMFVGNANPILLTADAYRKGENWKREFILQFGGIAINGLSTFLIKNSVERSRPFDQYPNQMHPRYHPQDYSFPSGHTSWAFQWATATSLYAKRWYVTVPCFLYASSIGYSRMVMGVHYPTDVMMGAIVGSGSAFVSHWITKKIFRNTAGEEHAKMLKLKGVV
jgi:membrane-associated phospholipid phosphatase